MPIAHSDQVYHLIKSLDKAEKRNFKLYVKRFSRDKNVKFIQLFDVLDKMSEYNEKLVMKKMPGTSSHQLSNLKRHLYTQILKSLRLIYIKKEIDVKIREQIDFARILYGKGLYLEALKLLNRSKQIADNSNQNFLLMEILEFEKLIESRHITRSRKVKDKVERLIKNSSEMKKIISNASDLANLNLKIQGLYIKIGHIKNEKDLFIVRDYFYSNLPETDIDKLGFFERVYLHQAYVWYYYTILNFPFSYRHAVKWIELFERKKTMIEKDPDLYMRGLHYCLTNLYYLQHYEAYEVIYKKFEIHYKKYAKRFNETSKLIYFIYGFNARLNAFFLKGEFAKGIKLIPEIEYQLDYFKLNLDYHRRIVYFYKIAWMFIAIGKYELALDRLNAINNLKKEHLRKDIHCYTRLLILICHFELGNYVLVSNLLASVKRFFKNAGEFNDVVETIMISISEMINHPAKYPEKHMIELHKRLRKYKKDYYEKRVFIYFDFVEWAASKSNGLLIAEIKKNAYQSFLQKK